MLLMGCSSVADSSAANRMARCGLLQRADVVARRLRNVATRLFLPGGGT